jgi:hypothetical protein
MKANLHSHQCPIHHKSKPSTKVIVLVNENETNNKLKSNWVGKNISFVHTFFKIYIMHRYKCDHMIDI